MWVANFLVAASATMVLPFLSLYIDSFGEYSNTYVQKWSGLIFGVTFLVAFFVSPLWGRFGDKRGFKKILIITGSGISLSIFLMGFANSVHSLFILRMIMGVVTGFIPTSLALISSQSPKETAGKVLGTLQTGAVSGGLFGPIIGGILADNIGFSYTFILTSVLIGIATIIVALGVREEPRVSKKKDEKNYSYREVLHFILTKPILLSVMITSLLIQVAIFSIQPLLALYVDELTTSANIALLSGLAFSATGLGNLLTTQHWGKLGDRIGYHKVIVLLLILAAIFFIPQAFVENIWQLIIFRFLVGTAIGGIIPCVTAYIRQLSPIAIQGEVLGYSVSFRFLGNVIGPVAGGFVSGVIGISSVFYATSALLLIGALVLYLTYWQEKNSFKQLKPQHN